MVSASRSWTCLGEAVRGANHVRQDKPCQDRILCKTIGQSVIVAIADGHGSSRSPFSDQGAEIAVEVATELLEQINYNYFNVSKNLSEIKHYAEEQLKKLIIRNWRNRVEQAYKKICDSLDTEDNFYIKFGTTLIAVIATTEFILFLQLGDGDILLNFDYGEANYAVQKDEELVGVETTSLCSKNAWKYMKTELYKLNREGDSVNFIMLSTDGYFNSFATDEGYRKTATDYMNLIKEHGNKKIQQKLGAWISEVSYGGCGDDITLAFIIPEIPGIKVAAKGRKPVALEKITLAIELYNSTKYKIKEIVEITGVSKSTIYKYLKE